MPRRIILRAPVPDDLHGIVKYLEQSSVEIANRFVDSVFAAFDDLAIMPGKGSPKRFRIARLSGVRSWAVPGFRNHLIFYHSTDEAIIVLAVLHGARNVREVLRGRVV